MPNLNRPDVSALHIEPIPILTSNYVWIVHPPKSLGGEAINEERAKQVYVVDPGDAKAVITYLKAQELTLAGLIITHSHNDHVTGIDEVLAYQSAPVYGPRHADIPQVTHALDGSSRFSLWDHIEVDVIETPGHLPEHLCYTFQVEQQRFLFCADIMFSSGCGRIFIGSPEELRQSLYTLAALPEETLVYCAHEYTEANLAFAQAVEPDNGNIATRMRHIQHLRQQGLPSLPSSIAIEKRVNPFIRCEQTAAISAATNRLGHPANNADEVFAALRQWKDVF